MTKKRPVSTTKYSEVQDVQLCNTRAEKTEEKVGVRCDYHDSATE